MGIEQLHIEQNQRAIAACQHAMEGQQARIRELELQKVELLEALRALTKAVEDYVPNPEDWPELKAASAVIAKATGEDA